MHKVPLLALFVLLSVPLTLAQTFEYFGSPITYGTDNAGADSVALADINGDGKLDVVVAGLCVNSANCGQNISVLLGNGDGTFQAPQTYSAGSGYIASSITVADVNGDGKPDLVVGTSLLTLGDCGMKRESLPGCWLGACFFQMPSRKCSWGLDLRVPHEALLHPERRPTSSMSVR